MSALKASEAPHQFTIKLLDKTINLRVEVQILNTFFLQQVAAKYFISLATCGCVRVFFFFFPGLGSGVPLLVFFIIFNHSLIMKMSYIKTC